MNIIFNRIKITNFLSLGSVEVDLENKGFVLVEGINKNIVDNAKSNGSGKSSIFEAIIWAVTGETIRGTKDIRNKLASDGACVELYFTIDQDSYKIVRFKEHSIYGNNLKLYRNDQDVSGKGIRDTEKILEDYLPDFNSQLLGSVIILGQGLPQRFTNNTPSGRKEILEKLSKSDFMIEDIKNRLSDRRSELNIDLRKVEDSILKYNTELQSLQKSNDTISMKLQQIKDQDMDLLLNNIESQKINLSLKQSDYNNTCNLLDSLYKESEDNKINLQNKLTESSNNFNSKTNDLNLQVVKYNSSINYIQQDIINTKNEINKLKNIQTVCPTCGRPFDDVHIPDTTDLESKQNRLEEELAEQRLLLDNCKNKLDDIKSEYAIEVKSINDYYEDILNPIKNKILIEMQNKQDQELYINKLQKDLNVNINQVEIIKTQKDALLETYNNNQIEMDKISKSLENLYIDKEDISKRMEAIQKMLTTAQREFRTYLLEDVVNYIDTKVKFYSKKLFKTDLTEFRNDGNQIWIGYAGKQYENLSGGEKQKIDILIQFALRDMLMSLLKFSSNLLVLDEVFDNLDQSGCEELINLIMEELKDVDSVFIITHHADVSIPYDDKLTIVKTENGISEVQ